MPPILSLEFTDLECKVAVVDTGRGGRATVKSLSVFDLPKPEDAAERVTERSKALRDHLKAQKITVKQASVVVPKNFIMVRAVNLPSTVDEEIAGMARFEAERHIPFNADRHITSYHVLAKNGAQGSHVLLAAVDLPIAQEYLDVCVKAGLRVTGISVSSAALFNSFAVARKADLDNRTVVLLNVGRSATDMVIATNGAVTFARGSTTGVNRLIAELEEVGERAGFADLPKMDALEPQRYFRGAPAVQAPAEPASPMNLYDELPEESSAPSSPAGDPFAAPAEAIEAVDENPGFTIIKDPAPAVAVAPENRGAVVFSDWLNRLLQEVKRTFEFASREFATPMVDQIYICGEGALVARVTDYFQANFNVDTAVFDPLAAGSPISPPKKTGPEAGPSYAVAVGGALAGQPQTLRLDLLPSAYTEAQSAKRQQVSYIVTGILALVALAVGYLYLSDTFARKRDLLDELIEQNRADRGRVNDLRTKQERLRIIKENVQDDRGALNVLQIISGKTYIPEKIVLTNFEYKRGDYVKLEGDAKDLPSANQLVNDMRNTGFFAQASLDSTTPNKQLRGRGGATVTGWKATFAFPKPEKPKSTRSAPKKTTEGDTDGFE